MPVFPARVLGDVDHMAVIRQSEAGTLSRDAIVLDLGDLARQAEALRQQAQAKAGEILAQARAERERLFEGVEALARREGFEKGYAEGLVKGRADGAAAAMQERADALKSLETAWSDSLAKLDEAHAEALARAGRDVIALAALIVRKVVHRAIETDTTIVVDQLAAALAMVAAPTRVVVSVHPDDLALAREALPRVAANLSNVRQTEVAADSGLARGSCIVRTSEGGTIDASIQTQVDRVIEAMLGLTGCEEPSSRSTGEMSGPPEDAQP